MSPEAAIRELMEKDMSEAERTHQIDIYRKLQETTPEPTCPLLPGHGATSEEKEELRRSLYAYSKASMEWLSNNIPLDGTGASPATLSDCDASEEGLPFFWAERAQSIQMRPGPVLRIASTANGVPVRWLMALYANDTKAWDYKITLQSLDQPAHLQDEDNALVTAARPPSESDEPAEHAHASKRVKTEHESEELADGTLNQRLDSVTGTPANQIAFGAGNHHEHGVTTTPTNEGSSTEQTPDRGPLIGCSDLASGNHEEILSSIRLIGWDGEFLDNVRKACMYLKLPSLQKPEAHGPDLAYRQLEYEWKGKSLIAQANALFASRIAEEMTRRGAEAETKLARLHHAAGK